MICAHCGTENPAGQRFCGSCGTALAQTCASCGAANPPGQRFCGECGAALGAETAAEASRSHTDRGTASRLGAVRRPGRVHDASESRDAEEVRELLSRYFDSCRRLIELYGGTVEKFIGDAVMAVWGTPIATEDDAERAVRAALDLVTAVGALGEELGAENLRARAGVLTGEAAVTLGATGQGMVAGDLVNTASRVQSVAEPGTVFVGEATRAQPSRRSSSRPRALSSSRARRVRRSSGGRCVSSRGVRLAQVAGPGGAVRRPRPRAASDQGAVPHERRREARTARLGHGHRRHRQVAALVGVLQVLRRIEQIVYWHRGRCLAYGDGVTYWALADMVRMRCGIAEDDEPGAALEKLQRDARRASARRRRSRVRRAAAAQLLGLGDHETRERQELFGAWRLFFERLAETYPTVLAFEDMQWADSSLLDFIEYLLESSRSHPIFVVTLARPSSPNAGRRGVRGTATSRRCISSRWRAGDAEMLGGARPGPPAALRDQILARAEGIPLYAVETVRMLLDRGLLAEDGLVVPRRRRGRVACDPGDAAGAGRRSARLALGRRARVVQDAAVLGKTFTLTALGALTGSGADELEPSSPGSSARSCSGCRPIRAHPSTASTASCRT